MLYSWEPVLTPAFEGELARRRAAGELPWRLDQSKGAPPEMTERERTAARAVTSELVALGIFRRIPDAEMADPLRCPATILGSHVVRKGALGPPPLSSDGIALFTAAMGANDVAGIAVGAQAAAQRIVTDVNARVETAAAGGAYVKLARVLQDTIDCSLVDVKERYVLHGGDLTDMGALKLVNRLGFSYVGPEEMLGDDLLDIGRWVCKTDAVKYYYVLALGPVNRSLYCFEPVRGEGFVSSNRGIMGAADTAIGAGGLLSGLLMHSTRVQFTEPDQRVKMYADDATPSGASEATANAALRILIDKTMAPARVQASAPKTEMAAQSLVVVGRQVDTTSGAMRLPAPNVYKYITHACVVDALLRSPGLRDAVSRKSIQKLYGCLMWWASVGTMSMRLNTRALCNASHATEPPSRLWQPIVKELSAWRELFATGRVPAQRLMVPGRGMKLGCNFASDADPIAGGAVYGAAAVFHIFTGDEAGYSIDLKELLMTVLALELLVRGDGAIILIETDNAPNAQRIGRGRASGRRSGGIVAGQLLSRLYAAADVREHCLIAYHRIREMNALCDALAACRSLAAAISVCRSAGIVELWTDTDSIDGSFRSVSL